ncbi:MAG: Eco57I restriction-modification methylase domain-containing protein, partial [Sporichthyaceae bacterium]
RPQTPDAAGTSHGGLDQQAAPERGGNSVIATRRCLKQVDRFRRGQESEELRDAVSDLAARYRFFHWYLEFPQIFDSTGNDSPAGWSGGFSAIVGNPPWERVKLQEQEFFSARNADIAGAPNAAARKKRISALQTEDPALWDEWIASSRQAEGESHLLRSTGRYPLCGVGDVNTYSVFAEHMRAVIAHDGRMGLISPTGLATDATTAAFFADTLRTERLAAFYDFDNEAKIFANVHHAFRFAVSCLTGGEPVEEARLAFVTRHVAGIPARRFALSASEILLLNPNTGTLPLFRTRTDAEITAGIYRRHPVLIRDDDPAGNPWGLRFGTLFHMANDSDKFRTADELTTTGAQFDGWAWAKGADRWLPLYEAKLLSHWDHRYSTYANATQAQLNMQTLPRVTDEQHATADLEALARYWVAEPEIEASLDDRSDRGWLLGWRDITGQEKWRTFVPSVLPRAAVGDKFQLAFPAESAHAPLLQAIWSSLPFDYVSRQKLSGTGMKGFIVRQLVCPAPAGFGEPAPWRPSVTLDAWVRPRVLELTYTSWRIAPYANDVLQIPVEADPGPPFRWIPERREMLRAELDAAMFHIFGLGRAETEHVLDSFPVVRKYEERDHGEFRTRRLVLDRYDAMSHAISTGEPYRTPLEPAPGAGPRHPALQPGGG